MKTCKNEIQKTGSKFIKPIFLTDMKIYISELLMDRESSIKGGEKTDKIEN